MAETNESGLKVKLLGQFEVWRDGVLISPEDWKRHKTHILLKILIGNRGRKFTQDELIEFLFPDLDPQKARHNLNARLSELRRVLEPHLRKATSSKYIITVDKNNYYFSKDVHCWIDTEVFQQQVQIAQEVQDGDRWQQAIETRLGQYRRAIARCHQALRSQEHRESIHRQLMLYYYLAGDQAEALKTYELCRETLAKQLDVEPSRETNELHQQILNRNIPGVDQVYKPVTVERHAIPYSLGKTPFVGRTKEYAVLVSHLQESHTGHGRALFIAGEAGIGKTRLVQEFFAHAREREACILQGHCSDLVTKLAFEPIIQALRSGYAQISQRLKNSLAPLWLAEVARLVPEFITLKELTTNPLLSPEQERHRLFEALTQLLITLGQEKLLVLFLDDLHWADSATSDFLQYSAPRISAYPIIILGTYRSEEAQKPPLAPLRDETGREIVHYIQLARLSVDETEKLLQEMGKMPEAVAGRLGRRLHQETEGNPFFLVAVLQALFEEGAMQVRENGVWATDIDEITANYRELLIPTKVKEVIQRRLGRLNEDERELLTLAAVAGRRFDYSLLEKAWSKPTTLDLIEKLTKAQLLIAENGHYEFSHDKIREVVYTDTSLPRRKRLHKQVAETIEQLHNNRLQEYYNILAHHFAQARELQKAFDYTLLALNRTMASHQIEEGLTLTDMGLQIYLELKAQQIYRNQALMQHGFEMLIHRFRLYEILGRRMEQEQTIAQASLLAEEADNENFLADTYLMKTRLMVALGKYSDAQTEARKALLLGCNLDNKQLEGKAEQMLGTTHWHLGEHHKALEHYIRAFEIAEEIGLEQERMQAVLNIGVVHHQLGNYEQALERYKHACELALKMGNKIGEAQSHKNIGVIHSNLGEYQMALLAFEKAYDLFSQIGEVRAQASTISNLGSVSLQIGKYDKALQYYEKAYELCKNIQDRNGEGQVLLGLGNLYNEGLGDYHKARDYFQRAYEHYQQLGSRVWEAAALCNLGEVSQCLIDYPTALRYYQEAQSIQQAVDDKLRETYTIYNIGILYVLRP
ncbi:tetratricopeptide repeat protein [Candidatus Acetothermia bacterium]|nr:tetratricopeptide repeat protein [Candidatus Acetothermia bacterium]